MAVVAPTVDSTTVFKNDIFKGKVLFCTGWQTVGFLVIKLIRC